MIEIPNVQCIKTRRVTVDFGTSGMNLFLASIIGERPLGEAEFLRFLITDTYLSALLTKKETY